MLNWIEKRLQEGLPIIKENYVLFIIVFSLGAIGSYFVVDKLYDNSLTNKDSTIQSQATAITNKNDKISELNDSMKLLKGKTKELQSQIAISKDESKLLKVQLGQPAKQEKVDFKLSVCGGRIFPSEKIPQLTVLILVTSTNKCNNWFYKIYD